MHIAYRVGEEFELFIFDPIPQTFRFLTYYPQHTVLLGEQFLQADTLLFQIRRGPTFDDQEDLPAGPG